MKIIGKPDASGGSGDIEGVTAGTGLSGGGTSGTVTLNVESAQPEITSLGVLTGLTIDGDKSVTPGDGAMFHIDASDITDSNTSASGTAAKYTHVSIEHPRLLATNASVTTTDAATLYISNAPTASTNQTITRAHALWVESGRATFGGDVQVVGTLMGNLTGDITGDVSGQAGTVATIAGLAPNTATTQATQGNITSCAELATVGTIGTGVWEGTAVATGYTKHLVHYDFQGYSTGNGTNWEISKLISANTAPFNHDNSTGSDGLTAQTVQTWIRLGGKVMPKACTLKRITGWSTCAGNSTANIGLFKVTPTRNDNSNVSAVELADIEYTAMGNAKMEDHDVTSFTATAIAAGDMLFTALKSASGAIQYSNITVEVEF